jgi:hypothetical protein
MRHNVEVDRAARTEAAFERLTQLEKRATAAPVQRRVRRDVPRVSVILPESNQAKWQGTQVQKRRD